MIWEILINPCLASYLDKITSRQKSIFQVSQPFYHNRYTRILTSPRCYGVVNRHGDPTHALVPVFVLGDEFLRRLPNGWDILRFQIATQ